MGKKGRTSSRNQRASVASCAICGAPCIPEMESAQKRVRCTQCGETYALVLAPVAREGWTVIDPKGNVASFDDSESARKSMPGGRLVLEPQSDPHMAPEPVGQRIDTPIQGTAVVEQAATRPSQPPTIRPPIEEGSESWLVTGPPSSTTELVAEELVESLPSEVSIKALSDRADKAADSGNPVSLDDVLEMMPAPRASKAPPLPSRAPPKSPVTIPAGSLEPRAARAQEDDEANGKGPRVVVASAPRIPVGLKKPVTVEQAEPEYPDDDDDEPRKTTSVRETLDEGQSSGRGWMIAVAVFAVLGIGFFAYARSGDSAPAKPGPTPAQTTSVAVSAPASASVAKVVAAPPASASAAPSASAVASSAPSAAPSASVAAPAASVAAGGGGGGEPATATAASDNPNQPIPDVLHAAHAAIRKGDAAGAQRQFERVLGRDPNNVEAIAGLGDIARAAGDTAKAKSSYEAALAKAPHYIPAQLALADIKWDTGEKSDAVARYAAIVEKLGDAAPARAKERANPN